MNSIEKPFICPSCWVTRVTREGLVCNQCAGPNYAMEPEAPKARQCCERDHNHDGNCDRHPGGAPAVLQPIATAPKGSQYILLFGPSGYTSTPLRCEVGRWSIERDAWVDYGYNYFTDGGAEPTHWAPLPVEAHNSVNIQTIAKGDSRFVPAAEPRPAFPATAEGIAAAAEYIRQNNPTE